MSKAYERLCAFVRAVTPAMTTQWEEPFRGDAIGLVCNHAGAFGPSTCVPSFPCGSIATPG